MEGKNPDLESSRLLQNALSDENYNTKRNLKSSKHFALLCLLPSQFVEFILIFMEQWPSG